MTVEALTRAEVNELLVEWEHPLGACSRPFGQDQHALCVHGEPVAVTVTASLVSSTIRDEAETTWGRKDAVELARIARSPMADWAIRPMLRLWRSVLAHEWKHWPVKVLVSYAMPGTLGGIYRFDGWTKVREVGAARPSAKSWSNTPKVNAIGDGRKTLWVYRTEVAA